MRIKDMQYFTPVFQEEILIDRPVFMGGRMAYLLAVCRKEDIVQIYLLAEHPGKETERSLEEKIWKKQRKGTLTRREEILARLQTSDNLMSGIKGVKTPQEEFEVSSMSAGGFEPYDVESFMMLTHFLEQGLSAEAVNEMKLSELDFITVELQGEFNKIPFTTEHLTLSWQPGEHCIPVKKKLKLEIGKQYHRKYHFYCEELEREITFYIDEVSLHDSWTQIQESKKHMIFPNMTEEQKTDLCQQMEEICPKGMYHLAIEYECEDGMLEFYARDQLREKVEPKSGAYSILLAGHKKEGPEYGPHGLKQRCCIIQYPITRDVTEIETELLTASIFVKNSHTP